jgi:hypothetical protein
MFGTLLRDVFADHEKQESYVKQSRLDWTIVRPRQDIKAQNLAC